MGVKDLLKILKTALKGNHGVLTDKLASADLGYRRVAVDTSVYMHKLLVRNEVAKAFHQIPPVCLQGFVDEYFDDLLKSFRAVNLTPIFVFDGRKHPLKGSTNDDRNRIRSEAQAMIDRLYASQDFGNIDEIVKQMKKSVYVREDLIACVLDWAKKNNVCCIGAPYEADWQLRQLEMQGIADAVLTIDSDLVALGCDTVILDWDMNSKEGKCTIIRKEDILDHLDLLENEFLQMCIFLGTDYIGRAKHKKGEKKILNWIKSEWCNFNGDEKEAYLRDLDSKDPGYYDKFRLNERIFYFAPVFKITPTEANMSAWDTLQSNDRNLINISLNALHDLPFIDEGTGSSWCDLIGFDPLADFASAGLAPIVRQLYWMDSWASTGSVARKLELPIVSGVSCPFGSVLDFDKVPHSMQFIETLVTWLRYHGIRVPTAIGSNRERIVGLAVRASELDHPIDHNTQDDSVAVGHYITYDKLFVSDTVIWREYSDQEGAEAIINVIRTKIIDIDDSFIDRIFGKQQNGIRSRALRATISGNYDLNSLKMATSILLQEAPQIIASEMEATVHVANETCTVFSVHVVPSLKSNNYVVYIVINESTGDYLPSPRSRCSCPAGQFFCSHMLGLYLIMFAIQYCNNKGPQDFLQLFPEPLKTIQSIPILLSEAMRVNYRSKSRKAKKAMVA